MRAAPGLNARGDWDQMGEAFVCVGEIWGFFVVEFEDKVKKATNGRLGETNHHVSERNPAHGATHRATCDLTAGWICNVQHAIYLDG